MTDLDSSALTMAHLVALSTSRGASPLRDVVDDAITAYLFQVEKCEKVGSAHIYPSYADTQQVVARAREARERARNG